MSRDSMLLLTTTTDFLSHFSIVADTSFSFVLCFIWVLCLKDQFRFNSAKFRLISEVILTIRSFLVVNSIIIYLEHARLIDRQSQLWF